MKSRKDWPEASIYACPRERSTWQIQDIVHVFKSETIPKQRKYAGSVWISVAPDVTAIREVAVFSPSRNGELAHKAVANG